MSDFVLGKAMLSEREKRELLAALQSLTVTGNTYPDSLLEKLTALFSASSESWFEVDFSRWENETRDKQYFELLKTAVLEKRCVKLHYVGMSAVFSERIVQPVKLLYKARAWYLHAKRINPDMRCQDSFDIIFVRNDSSGIYVVDKAIGRILCY